ncbi:protein kinase [Lichtheimia corymbifera JMRC:FSU:9682]|uniref:non-specific serine/threonine protein kinase n=1 Tax=Lichtheimia corymbifera JMRC:FSU:9682 TaxID=1263082 RepID=A0A068RV54_9FUNG|nr:protein kinase [Lichtheimia corymbifera JMRC:FSU:9682]
MGMPLTIGSPHQQQRTPPPSTTPTSARSSEASTVSVPSPKSLKRNSLPPKVATINTNTECGLGGGNIPSSPQQPIQIPWRCPGKWQMPDIIEEAWKRRQQEQRFQQQQKKDNDTIKKTLNTNTIPLHKRPWIPVGRVPDILPFPPPIIKPQQHLQHMHPEFEGKLRKVLPKSKSMEGNPHKCYVAMARIGSGANGAVMRATKRNDSTCQVAIKRCLIEDHDVNHHTYVLREIRIMGCINHRNLIQLREAGMWKDDLWMAMELMQCSVFNLLYNTTQGLPEPVAVCIARQVLEGLIYLHSKNYMHRDVKCENILLGRDGQVKLADFGLATPLTKTNSARLGTAKWMAPEVIAEEPYTENVDVWSLAITMIEMMDRVPPLYDLDDTRQIFYQILYGKPPSFTFSKPSPTVQSLIRWMLDPDSQRRPYAKMVREKFDTLISEGRLGCTDQTEVGALVQEVFCKPSKN